MKFDLSCEDAIIVKATNNRLIFIHKPVIAAKNEKAPLSILPSSAASKAAEDLSPDYKPNQLINGLFKRNISPLLSLRYDKVLSSKRIINIKYSCKKLCL